MSRRPTRILRLADDPVLTNAQAHPFLREAADCLAHGGLVAFPTETVYGLGANATDPEAVHTIFEAKGRPATNPVIVHVADRQQARTCVAHWTEDADRLADALWPGPLTIVLPRASIIPDVVTAGLNTVGLRMPDHDLARALIAEADRPIAAPSANRSTQVSPTTADHVLDGLDGRIDLILDGGPCQVGLESTIVDLSSPDQGLRILRLGTISNDRIAAILGRPVAMPAHRSTPDPKSQGETGATTTAYTSPGQMLKHYAPTIPTHQIDINTLHDRAWRGDEALLVLGIDLGQCGGQEIFDVQGPRVSVQLVDPKGAAHRLYATLREFERSGASEILIAGPPDAPDWHAIRDRIQRASVG